MDRRSPAAATVVANISAVRKSSGVTVSALSNAASVPASILTGRTGERELTFGEMQDVGGVLRVSPAVFFKGVASA